LYTAGLANIGLLDTATGDVEATGPFAALFLDDARHTTTATVVMTTAAATPTAMLM